MTYYNTTHLAGETLTEKEGKTETQEQIILEMFKKHKRFSPFQVYRRRFAGKAPITSVRRAIHDLTKAGKLRKTDEKVPGQYDDPEHVWELNEPQMKLF